MGRKLAGLILCAALCGCGNRVVIMIYSPADVDVRAENVDPTIMFSAQGGQHGTSEEGSSR